VEFLAAAALLDGVVRCAARAFHAHVLQTEDNPKLDLLSIEPVERHEVSPSQRFPGEESEMARHVFKAGNSQGRRLTPDLALIASRVFSMCVRSSRSVRILVSGYRPCRSTFPEASRTSKWICLP
jgi:hypothetical protein